MANRFFHVGGAQHRRIGWATVAMLSLSCSTEPTNDNSTGGDTYNGQWVWYENDQPVYQIEIQDQEIVSLEPLSANAKTLRFTQARARVTQSAGLRYLEFWEDSENPTQGRTRYTFNFENYGTQSCKAEDCVLKGDGTQERITESSDEFPVPSSYQAGELRRVVE